MVLLHCATAVLLRYGAVQVEKHYPNGVKEISFPDKTTKIITPEGLQESHFPDGVVLREHPDGRREVLASGDQRDEVSSTDS